MKGHLEKRVCKNHREHQLDLLGAQPFSCKWKQEKTALAPEFCHECPCGKAKVPRHWAVSLGRSCATWEMEDICYSLLPLSSIVIKNTQLFWKKKKRKRKATCFLVHACFWKALCFAVRTDSLRYRVASQCHSGRVAISTQLPPLAASPFGNLPITVKYLVLT